MPTKAVGMMHAVRLMAPSLTLVLAVVVATPAQAQEQSLPGGFAPDQVQGIEQIIRSYLLEHPEVLIKSLTAYQQRQKLANTAIANAQTVLDPGDLSLQDRQQAVIEQRSALSGDPDSPALGNPDGDVLIVEFFDYRCPYCRKMAPRVRKAVESDGNIRLVMKEWPILGPQSIQAARTALAAAKQGKYEAFHFALMTEPGDMSDPHIRQIARTVGLDVDRLQEDMRSADIDAMIRRNHELARALDINGTPAFVIGDTLVPGAIDLKTLQGLVAKARDAAS